MSDDISSMLPPPPAEDNNTPKSMTDPSNSTEVSGTPDSIPSEPQPETLSPSVTTADTGEIAKNTPPVPTSEQKDTDSSQTNSGNQNSQDTSQSSTGDGNPKETNGSVTTAEDAPTATESSATTVKSPAEKYQEVTDMLFARMAPVGSDTHFKCMFYGPPGGTKSSMLDVPHNLIYDQEDGLISMKAWAAKNGRPLNPGIQAIPFTSFTQADLLMDRLIQQVDEVKPFKVFSIDTFNDFHRKALMEIVARKHRNAPQSVNRWVPVVEDHQENNERMMDIVRKLRDLPMDIIITAHSKTVEPKNELPKTYPDFSESLANKIEAMMDLVGYVEMREIDGEYKPVMRVVSNGMIHAKNRMNLPPEIINPTWQQLKTAWEQTVKE